MTLLEISILLFLITWFTLSVFYQVPFMKNKLRKFDFFKILPTWTFFSPNPIKHDSHLLYRDRNENKITKWAEIDIVKKNNFISTFWNPEKRVKKNLLSINNSFSEQILLFKNKNDRLPTAKDLENTNAYKVTMSIVLSEKAISTESIDRQFMIIKTYGFICNQEFEVLIVSPFQRLKEI